MGMHGEDQKLRKAFFKKHAKSVKGWVAQRKAMKAKFIATLKMAKSALKKAGIKADVTRFFKDMKAIKKGRDAMVKRNIQPKVIDAFKAGGAAAKAIFA